MFYHWFVGTKADKYSRNIAIFFHYPRITNEKATKWKVFVFNLIQSMWWYTFVCELCGDEHTRTHAHTHSFAKYRILWFVGWMYKVIKIRNRLLLHAYVSLSRSFHVFLFHSIRFFSLHWTSKDSKIIYTINYCHHIVCAL